MIELRDINKIYRKDGSAPISALSDVSLNIENGEFVAIVGESGSGKSTLMNILGLLDRPSSGTYLLDGRDVSGLGVDEVARLRNQKVGFVFQAFHLLDRTSALENVELPLIYSEHTKIEGLAANALAIVGLEDRADHFPNELSGGQQQRVAIARALVNSPEIILADEPSGNLDSRTGMEIMAIFQDLNRQGRTVVLITHDLGLAQHAHRLITLEDGKITSDERVVNPKDAAVALEAMQEPATGVS